MKRLLLAAMAVAAAGAIAAPSIASASEVTFSGQYRLRGEYRNNADFIEGQRQTNASGIVTNNSANDHTNMWVQRVRLTANAKATDDTSVKITLQDTRTFGTNSGPTSTNQSGGGPNLTDNGNNYLDTHEAYLNVANIFGSPIAFRAGRQELVYGDERLIGAFGWNNNGRSFDAFKLMYGSEVVDVDLFTSRINVQTTVTDGTQTESLHGLYATVKAVPNNVVDLYVLNLRNKETNPPVNTFGNTTGNNTPFTGSNYYGTQNLYTFGARIKGGAAGVDYTLEVPVQRGSLHSTSSTGAVPSRQMYNYDIKAYAYAAKVGYTLKAPVKTRIGVEYDYASGDNNKVQDSVGGSVVADTKLRTFYNLFPTNHDKLGLMDMQSWRNVKAWNVNLTVDPTEKLKLFASYWKFALAQERDGWYNASDWITAAGSTAGVGAQATHTNPTVAYPNANNFTKDVGSEFDFVATYKYNSALTIEAGAAHFWAGEFIKNQIATPGSGNTLTGQDWAYLQFTANF